MLQSTLPLMPQSTLPHTLLPTLPHMPLPQHIMDIVTQKPHQSVLKVQIFLIVLLTRSTLLMTLPTRSLKMLCS